MADSNAIVLAVPIPEGTPADVRRQVLRHAAEAARVLKLRELRRGVGADGKKLAKVKQSSRPDGAKGPALSPHQPESRSQKWLRVTVGEAAGTVTLWWSHGWGRILGYHARGEVKGAPARDVIGGLAPRDMKEWEGEVARYARLVARPKPAPRMEVEFRMSEAGKLHDDVAVTVVVGRVDADLARDAAYHVGPGGKGGRPGSYAAARKQVAAGKPVAMPRMALDVAGDITVRDGRHRFAALRDGGLKVLPVSVPPAEAAAIRAKYGPKAPPNPKPKGPVVAHVARRKHAARVIQVYEE